MRKLQYVICVSMGCTALASLRHKYLGSYFLEPDNSMYSNLVGHLELQKRRGII